MYTGRGAGLNNHSESLVVQIYLGDNTFRDALPVRAIPHVTGWVGDFGVPPLEVAIRLQTNINLHAWEVVAFRLIDGKPVAIQPRQWEMVETQLAGFSNKLHRLYPRDEHHRPSHEGLAEWQSQATEKLPSRAFVWLDEFKAEYLGWYGAKFKTRPNLVIPEFDLTPLLSEQVRKMVLEGFEPETKAEQQVVQSLLDEIDKLKADIKRWEDKDESIPSEALIKEKELGRLYTKLVENEGKKRVLRGDYFDFAEVSQSVANSLISSQAASVATVDIPEGMSWTLIKPQRFQGYSKPLYDLLRAAHIAEQPCPKARDVLETWKKNPPLDVSEVTDNGLKYYDTKGNTKPADLEAIRKTIGRMIKVVRGR